MYSQILKKYKSRSGQEERQCEFYGLQEFSSGLSILDYRQIIFLEVAECPSWRKGIFEMLKVNTFLKGNQFLDLCSFSSSSIMDFTAELGGKEDRGERMLFLAVFLYQTC